MMALALASVLAQDGGVYLYDRAALLMPSGALVYVDAGVAFASAEQSESWEDLGARREGAPAHGRRVVLRAAAAWEGR